MNKYTNKTYLVTPDGKVIKVYYNFKKGLIKSYTKGGVPTLRKWGWDIEKLTHTKPNHNARTKTKFIYRPD